MQRGVDKPVEDINKIKSNPQGGKAFGRQLKVQESDLDRIGAEFKRHNTHVEDELLEKYKQKFMLYDRNHNGELGLDEVKFMMEKLGQPKTHLELKKMIAQVDKTGSGTIEYPPASIYCADLFWVLSIC
jgi:allograft inflammatory factor 1